MDDLLYLTLIRSLANQVTHMVNTMAKKNQVLASIMGSLTSTQGELESFLPHNTSLTQELVDYTSSTIEAVSQSFENALQQVEHFHYPLTISWENNLTRSSYQR